MLYVSLHMGSSRFTWLVGFLCLLFENKFFAPAFVGFTDCVLGAQMGEGCSSIKQEKNFAAFDDGVLVPIPFISSLILGASFLGFVDRSFGGIGGDSDWVESSDSKSLDY